MSSMSNPPGSLTDVTPYGVLTGLLWFSISDVQDKLTSITQAYTHVNPKDPTDIFCTYLIKNTKIGIPFGNLDKIREVIGKFTFEDRRNAIPFDTPKYPQLKLRDYQQVAMNEMLEYVAEGGTSFNLAGVPGAGKSYMLSNLLAQLGLKTLIIANQRMLISQLAEEAEKVLNTKVTILNAKNTEIGDINIATSQFIAQHSDVWYQIKDKISVLVLDEAEALASPTVTKIFQRCPARYKIFISATFSRSVDNRTDALVDFAGYKKITLQATGNLIPTVVCVHCPEIFNAPMDKSMYVRAKGNFFKQSSIFNKIVQITEYSVAKNRQCLIGIDIIEIQEKLKSLLAERGIRAELLNGGTSEAERIRILEEYDKGEVKVLIGFAVLNAGLSIPKISTIIRVSTPSSKEKLEQFIGRGVRHFEGKEGCYVIDLVFKGFQNKSRQALYALKSRVEQWKVYNTDWDRFKGSLTQS